MSNRREYSYLMLPRETAVGRYNRNMKQILANRQAWLTRFAPVGAPSDQWQAWVEWRNARRDMFDIHIRKLQLELKAKGRSNHR